MASSLPAPPPRGYGVSLAAFDSAIAAIGGPSALTPQHTTAWVKEHLVMPATRSAGVPYTEVLASLSASYVGEACAFVSHAYAYPFLTVVEAVRAWEGRQPASSGPFFYYFDLFVVNQHGQSMGVMPAVLWAEFCGNVARIGRTLLVCAWRTTILPFTRVWCLAEIATALGGGSPDSFAIIMPPEEEAAFAASLAHTFDDLVRKACSIDLAAAQAYHCDHCLEGGVCRHVASQGSDHIEECPNDCAFVRAAIRDGMGFEEANSRVAAVVRQWMAGAGCAALAALPLEHRDASPLASGYARLLSDQGRLAEAGVQFTATLAARRQSLGEAHPATLSATYDLGFLLTYQAQLGPGEALLRAALAGQRAALGSGHPDTLKTALALARCLHEQRAYAEGHALFEEVVAGRREALGRGHGDTLEALKHHGVLLEKWGRAEAAGQCLAEALAGQREALGEHHPQTLSTMHKLGTLMMGLGRVGEARPLYMQAWAGRQRVLGRAHPHTLWSVSKVGRLLQVEGRWQEAVGMLEAAQQGFLAVFGEAHPATVEAVLFLKEAREGLAAQQAEAGAGSSRTSSN